MESAVLAGLQLFFDGWEGSNVGIERINPTGNNFTFLCRHVNGERVVLRIYNNSHNLLRIQCEHAILKALRLSSLSFRVPRLISTKASAEESLVVLPTGEEICCFEFIEGNVCTSKLEAAIMKDIGRVSGELLSRMAELSIPQRYLQCAAAPYREMYSVHHAVRDREGFHRCVFDDSLFSIEISEQLWKEFSEFECKLAETLVPANLPTQLIHADFNRDNLLCSSRGVVAVLDFEFCTVDWRAMDLAVCLTKLTSEGAVGWAKCQDYLQGLSSAPSFRLTRRECELLPELVRLRLYSNLVYFAGRALAGALAWLEDSRETFHGKVLDYLNRLDWIAEHEMQLRIFELKIFRHCQ